jgi:hypothetical protein
LGALLRSLGRLTRSNGAVGASDGRTGARHVVATGFGLHECDPVLSSLSIRVRVRFAPRARSRINDDRCDGHAYIERERVRVTHYERVSRRTSTKQDPGSRTGFVCPDTRGRARERAVWHVRSLPTRVRVCADAVFQGASVQHSWPAACWKAQAGHMDQTQPDVHGVLASVQLRRFRGAGNAWMRYLDGRAPTRMSTRQEAEWETAQ